MSYIKKPVARHPALPKNAIGLTVRDYEGSLSTLCAGCGHDSTTAAIVQAFWSLGIEPHTAVKLSGIGCSSKTPTYFLGEAHGFNSVHGRMPSVATGANAANQDLTYIGISGDGDSLSIGLGQFCHAIRRNVNLAYICENNGVYGLTKGQFSASADVGSKSKKGETNEARPIDPVMLAITLGATFVARGFSGDKGQLVPILEAALRHKGFAFVDVISPCVAFNDHKGSTKSYMYTRENYTQVTEADLVPLRREIIAKQVAHEATTVKLHDGSVVTLRCPEGDYDATDRGAAFKHLSELKERGEVATGLLYVEESDSDMHSMNRTAPGDLVAPDWDLLCPGNDRLQSLMAEFR
ncbi:MAG: 2-oxoacid:ferredoxin oxidoreductase subunit beta [Deltaproteobacteria bacterium]|nr:2-oxoacid:ferredoxin oxidoreductase subunit beta [Deltaproteobacteria bacterium]